MREKKEINVEIGERVKLSREQAKLTQEQLAERIEVSTQYISDLERGVVGISIPTLRRLCISLGISSDQILFSTPKNDELSSVLDKCRSLSTAQILLLSDMINSFTEAVAMERRKQK